MTERTGVGDDTAILATAPLRVVVASRNPAKLTAVRDAFNTSFPDATLEIISARVDSGVAGQPTSDGETRQGALNRARKARSQHPDAEYWVGLEGGVETIEDELLAFAWMAVLDTDNRLGIARSPTLPLPPGVRARVEDGQELGAANDAVFGTVGSKERGGAFSLLTGGRLTREGVYAETLCLALLPFTNLLYRANPIRTTKKTTT